MTEVTEVKHVGTKETKEVLVLLFTGAKVAKEAKENDGAINMMDIGLLMTLIPKISPAFEDIDKVIEEVKDLDAKEVEELIEFISTEVGVLIDKNDMVSQIVSGLKFIQAGFDFYKTF